MSSRKELIEKGKTVLGIEFGSTRIKAVLIDENRSRRLLLEITSGRISLENGIWTYSLDAYLAGTAGTVIMKLAFNVEAKLWSGL